MLINSYLISIQNFHAQIYSIYENCVKQTIILLKFSVFNRVQNGPISVEYAIYCLNPSQFMIPQDCAALIHFGEGFEDDDIFDDIPIVVEDFSDLPADYHDFKDVFSSVDADILPEHRKYEILLKVPSAVPPFHPIFNLPEADRNELSKQIVPIFLHVLLNLSLTVFKLFFNV